MACYHLNVSIIGRKSGSSIVGAAAYNNRCRLKDEYYGITYDRSYLRDILYKGVLLPADAPERLENLQVLLNELNAAEKRKDSQLAQSFKLALPLELTSDDQHSLIVEFCRVNFTDKGRCVNYAIHSGFYVPEKTPSTIVPVFERKDNPHAHLIVPLRKLDACGFKPTKQDGQFKNRSADLIALRESWANIQNRAFERLGLDVRVSHKSLLEQGVDREPSIHIGAVDWAKAMKGESAERVNKYRSILLRNQELDGDQRNVEEKEGKQRDLLQKSFGACVYPRQEFCDISVDLCLENENRDACEKQNEHDYLRER